jgi:hypothetical protein
LSDVIKASECSASSSAFVNRLAFRFVYRFARAFDEFLSPP